MYWRWKLCVVFDMPISRVIYCSCLTSIAGLKSNFLFVFPDFFSQTESKRKFSYLSLKNKTIFFMIFHMKGVLQALKALIIWLQAWPNNCNWLMSKAQIENYFDGFIENVISGADCLKHVCVIYSFYCCIISFFFRAFLLLFLLIQDNFFLFSS